MNHPFSFSVFSFSLTAAVKFYSECVPAGDTVFEWSCNNTDVPLNLKTQYSRTLYVEAGSIPGKNRQAK